MKTCAKSAKWGLGFFVFGVFLTFGVIGHYCVGASADVGELFRRKQTHSPREWRAIERFWPAKPLICRAQ
jgi:hypothetical protein